MPQFEEHIHQAKRNLSFLREITAINDSYDWQVTVCFYTALHLINAHLSKSGLQYRKHSEVDLAINPKNLLSLTRLPDDEYVAYSSLYKLSRRSRYLVNLKDGQIGAEAASLTHDRHLSKALKHLDLLLEYFNKLYNLNLIIYEVNLPIEAQSHRFNYFSKLQPSTKPVV